MAPCFFRPVRAPKVSSSSVAEGCPLHMCICRWTSSTASCEAASSTFLTRSGQPWGVTSCLGKENRLGPKVKLASWAGQGSFLQFERGRFLHYCIFEVTVYVSDLGAPIVRVTFGFIDSPSVLADGSFGTKVANLLPPSCNPFPLIEPLCCIFRIAPADPDLFFVNVSFCFIISGRMPGIRATVEVPATAVSGLVTATMRNSSPFLNSRVFHFCSCVKTSRLSSKMPIEPQIFMQHSVFRPRSSEGDSDGFQRQCGHRKFPSSAMAYLQLVNPVQELPGNVYSYYRAGDISNLNPPQGEMAGGTRVTIETTDLDATIVAVGLGVGGLSGRAGSRAGKVKESRAFR